MEQQNIYEMSFIIFPKTISDLDWKHLLPVHDMSYDKWCDTNESPFSA